MTTVKGAARAVEVAREIAREVAGPAAPEVDRENRFPSEAFEALREERVLGLLVPEHLGGLGGRITDACDIATALGAECLSTALIWAMHSQQLAIMADHASDQWGDAMRNIATRGQLV